MRNKTFSSCRAILVVVFALNCVMAQAQVSARIVSANPHDQNVGSGGIPMSGVADSSVIDANAFHVGSGTDVTAVLGFPHNGKPKILSTDAGVFTASQLKDWLRKACNKSEHFEHFDAFVGEGPMAGHSVTGIQDFPQESLDALQVISDSHANRNCPSTLSPGGTLTRNGREFRWNNQEVSLVGYSWMGALVTPRFDIAGYLDVLELYNVNLTRVWAIEQWTAFAVNDPTKIFRGDGYTPFGRNIDIPNRSLDLNQVDSQFIQRLQDFVSAASNRGIVVQLTLFDRHGLQNKDLDTLARWSGNPYNRDNNVNNFLSAGCTNKTPKSFINTSGSIASVNSNFIQEVVDALDAYGNVIFEIINEPLARTNTNCNWSAGALETWHDWVANQVKNAP